LTTPFPFGALGSTRAFTHGKHRLFEMRFDDVAFAFTIERRRGLLFIAAMKVAN
jgi:hypothetical protein